MIPRLCQKGGEIDPFKAVDVQLIVALHLHGLILLLFDSCTKNLCENYSRSHRAAQVPRVVLTLFTGEFNGL